MNLTSVLASATILSAQILPNWEIGKFNLDIGNYTYNNINNLSLDSSSCVVTDSDFTYNLSFSDDSYVSDTFDNINNFSLNNIIESFSEKIPNSLEYGFQIYIDDAVDSFSYDVYLNSYNNTDLDLELVSESVSNFTGNYYSIYFTIDDFDTYYYDYGDLYLTFSYSCDFSGSVSYMYKFGFIFDYVDGYFSDDTVLSYTSYDFINFLYSKYYYNLGLENAVDTPSGFYNIIYDFIENDLLGTSNDTYGLPTILTQASIILIFIALIMLLVWIFKYIASLL